MPMRTCNDERRVRLVQLRDRLQDPEAGADRALGVVLVRDGCPEDRHDRVPDELLDRTAVALDLLAEAAVVGADAGADVLGVGRFGGSGETDEVAEEDRDDLALLVERRGRLLAQRSAAERAERKLTRELLAAGGTRGHPPSLGRLKSPASASPEPWSRAKRAIRATQCRPRCDLEGEKAPLAGWLDSPGALQYGLARS